MYHNKELTIPKFIISDNECHSPESHLNKKNIRFTELEIGDEFYYYNDLLTKQMKCEYIKYAEKLYDDYINKNQNSQIQVEISLSEIDCFGSKIQYPQYSIVNIQ